MTMTIKDLIDGGEEKGLDNMMGVLGYGTGFGECNEEEADEVRDSYLDATAVLREKYDRAMKALAAIEAHHIATNERQGRPVTRSNTIRLAREGMGR